MGIPWGKGSTEMNIVVYTACFGNYDKPYNLVNLTSDVRYVWYTDKNSRDKPKGWKVIRQRCFTKTAVRDARHRKICLNRYRPIWEADCSIWIDSNMELLADPNALCEEYLDGYDWAMFTHPHRRNIIEEARECMRPGYERDKPAIMNAQIQRYAKEGNPMGWRLMSTGLLIRRHTDSVKEFCEAWWKEVRKGSHRDQLSFPYTCFKLGLVYNVILGDIFKNPLVSYKAQHAGRRGQPKFV